VNGGSNKNRCPICDKPASTDAGNKWRPFCSQRCKLADLGQWFAERYTIPADPDPGPPTDSPPAGPPESPDPLSRQ
jgi:hypothetical protein